MISANTIEPMAPTRKPNLTGFDIRRLAASSGTPANDPWARTYVNALSTLSDGVSELALILVDTGRHGGTLALSLERTDSRACSQALE